MRARLTQALAAIVSWFSYRHPSLMDDAQYAAHAEREAELKRQHRNSALARKAKSDRLHALLRNPSDRGMA